MAEPTKFVVDARDVLDANAKTCRVFQGRIRGYFRRTGPNRWDDYEYVAQDAGVSRVLPGLRVQLEADGVEFRMRNQGKVMRVEWLPNDDEKQQVDSLSPEERRVYFTENYLERFGEQRGLGAAAVIARKLGR
jgi:hypothetical protein